MVRIFTVFFTMVLLQSASFRETQLTHSRVKAAYQDKENIVKAYFSGKQLSYEGFGLFIRAFKKEMELEVWVKGKSQATFILLHTYRVCTTSGSLGPKRQEGDYQIPEGVYHINHFNPQSKFHLSLGLNYPNASDKILSDRKQPGSAIYIHGSCVTIGCIPLTDDKIKELYILAVEAKNDGQQNIPVHVFPCRMTDAGMSALKQEFSDAPALLVFWENLHTVYKDFEATAKLRDVRVNSRGEYYLTGS